MICLQALRGPINGSQYDFLAGSQDNYCLSLIAAISIPLLLKRMVAWTGFGVLTLAWALWGGIFQACLIWGLGRGALTKVVEVTGWLAGKGHGGGRLRHGTALSMMAAVGIRLYRGDMAALWSGLPGPLMKVSTFF